jgi:hypothetical protein
VTDVQYSTVLFPRSNCGNSDYDDIENAGTEGRQTTEFAIAVASLNRMLELGRPVHVRLI